MILGPHKVGEIIKSANEQKSIKKRHPGAADSCGCRN